MSLLLLQVPSIKTKKNGRSRKETKMGIFGLGDDVNIDDDKATDDQSVSSTQAVKQKAKAKQEAETCESC